MVGPLLGVCVAFVVSSFIDVLLVRIFRVLLLFYVLNNIDYPLNLLIIR